MFSKENCARRARRVYFKYRWLQDMLDDGVCRSDYERHMIDMKVDQAKDILYRLGERVGLAKPA